MVELLCSWHPGHQVSRKAIAQGGQILEEHAAADREAGQGMKVAGCRHVWVHENRRSKWEHTPGAIGQADTGTHMGPCFYQGISTWVLGAIGQARGGVVVRNGAMLDLHRLYAMHQSRQHHRPLTDRHKGERAEETVMETG